MRTELRQIIGKRPRRNNVEYVEYPIDRVMFDSRQVGQIGHGEGANLAFFSNADPADFDEIRRDVVELRGGVPIHDKVAQAQAIPEEMYEDDDDEQ